MRTSQEVPRLIHGAASGHLYSYTAMSRNSPPTPGSATIDADVFDVRVISRFALGLLQQNSLDDLLWELAENVGKLLGFDDCVVYLREGDVLVQAAAYGVKNPAGRDIQNPITIQVGDGIVGAVCESGRSELVGDTEMDPRYIYDQYSGKSELSVPIMFEDKVLGVLDSESDVRNGFDDADLKRFEALANICAPRIAQCLTQRNLDRALNDLLIAADRSMETTRQLQQEVETRKQAEQALQEHKDQLQYLVDERTRALQEREAQLHQAQKMEAIGTLAGGIAHDFNNVLAGISGYTDLALNATDMGPQAAEHVEQVRLAAQRAADLVRQILSFSRNTSSDKAVIDLVEVVDEALRLMRPTLPSSIEVVATRDLDEALVLADPTQMHQVLLNLCTNASAAIGNNPGSIKIHLAPAGESVSISVTDTGCGIREEDAQRIFDPFYTTKDVGEGTGLGLSVVSSIIDNHGGDIEVSSLPDRGTCFTIHLPLSANGKSPEAETEEQPRQGSGRVLLVDDEIMILRLYETMLVQSGYQVTLAQDGEEALALYEAEPEQFDVVVSDETMPRMHGSQLALKIRDINPQQPFILCSGFHASHSDGQAGKSGVSRYLNKPVKLTDLAQLVGELLGEPAR